ncbi:hypothetical protein GYMLUDRAFT_32541 [Collybiopsis luxurians FD-317 M1]|nr:hypothetical protein GYMLUDRAFT_32541 [Collybiopsis luxurians FD-317 M1]
MMISSAEMLPGVLIAILVLFLTPISSLRLSVRLRLRVRTPAKIRTVLVKIAGENNGEWRERRHIYCRHWRDG